jgi:superfamily II DNA or RNA helicase
MDKLDPKYFNLCNGDVLSSEQVEGVEFLMKRFFGILAFQTGLGKTVTALTSMKVLLDRHPNARGIVICPVKAVKIFKKELTTKLGYKSQEIGILTNQELEYDVRENKVFILTTTSLEKYFTLILELSANHKLVMILDEAHQMQDNKSGLYKLMEELKKYFTAIWFATATPMLNDLDSLYNVVTFLDPNFFGGKTAFMNRYTISRLKDIYIKGGAKRKVRDVQGYRHLDELQERLKPIMIMRQRKYNLKFTTVTATLSDEEMQTYERVSKGIFGDEKKNFSQRMHDLQRLVDNSYEDEMINTLADSTKEKLLLDSLKSIMRQGFSVVLYADYLDTIDRLDKVLHENQEEIGFRKLFQIKGGIDFKVRGRIEEEIEERDIILVTRAGTESINLQKANCVLMYDIPYSIKDCIQLIGRVTRMDTTHSFQYIIILWTKGTIDEYKYLLFQDYATLIKQVLGSDANLPANLSEVDRKNLQKLKDRLLWVYKDVDRKMVTAKKRMLKENIILCRSVDLGEHISTYMLSLNPKDKPIPDTKRAGILVPEEADYQAFIQGTLPISILRNRYIDKLKSDEGKQILGVLVDTVVNKNSVVVLADDFGIGLELKKFILDNVKL